MQRVRSSFFHHTLFFAGASLFLMFLMAMTSLAAESTVDVRKFVPIKGDAAAGAAKSTVCGACHGADGNAVIPGYPSLAGQRIDYIYLQLMSFSHEWRTAPVMKAQIASLNEQDFSNLAAHYASLSRGATAGAVVDETAQRGKAIYLSGVPDKGIPPCQGCHGSMGEGLIADRSRDTAGAALPSNYRTYPVIAGLSTGYVQAQLAAYKTGTRSGTTNARIMMGVAQSIEPDVATALGAYLQTLRVN